MPIPTEQYQIPPKLGITNIAEGTAQIQFRETFSSIPPTNMIDGMIKLTDDHPMLWNDEEVNQLDAGNGFAGGQMKLTLGCLDINDLKWDNPGEVLIDAMRPKTFIPVTGGQRGDAFGLGSFKIYPTNSKLMPEASVWFPQMNTPISIK